MPDSLASTRAEADPVGIIGGGLAGLSAACVLAARGHRVVLWEENETLGGSAAGFQRGGYRFDLGPTILTMPRVLHRILAEGGHGTTDLLDLRRIDPQCRCFFQDGTQLDLTEDMSAMRARLGAFSPGSGAAYRDVMNMAARMQAATEKYFFWRSVDSPGALLEASTGGTLAALSEMTNWRPGGTVHGQIRRLVADPRVAQMLNHVMRHSGSSPFASPAMLCGMAHLQTNEGVWYPMGGTQEVARVLETVARAAGVEFRTGLMVTRIVSHGGSVAGVETADGHIQQVNAVVSTMDSGRTYRELVGGPAQIGFSRRWTREPSFSGVVLCLGLDRAYPHLHHHNAVLSRNAEEEFWFIHELGEVAPDPTCYVTAPARTEPGVAPEGGDALHVLVHTPYLRRRHDWRAMLPEYRRVILDKLKRTAGLADIEDRIVVEVALTPQDFHDRFGLAGGALYGPSSHGRLFGAFRPANRSRELPGLYLAGASAHPGPGMAMTMMSGWIAADALDADMGASGGGSGRGPGAVRGGGGPFAPA